ncbi:MULTISPECIES: magnesium transporter CorA family protein [Cloacibacillus]|uniref:Magnesium transporter n=1 Tax=Cloacibacillus porcorum TaxID=1197717 RepID=A0A1B2I2B7_9BACT|nr:MULTISPECIES: magnesium transporter CorA family protein [Cloacibacillus]ANZ44102.1 magnesium transporter [Cloacibacillus porcorum]EXG78420.1 Mg2+/Co2+ transporter [Cloacibacillus evryensis DSM 19522]MCC8183282.1 magnesium transporter CorA family protein [Cloacibacillus porcorum]MDD7649098.1 magnesium transporter CorA family protein [Cloacibacillus porcorum]MDY4094728.1 magnesium transporter CorA family protein [Cloacibacillus porcorum]
MLKITKTTESQLIELTPDRIEVGAWINLVRPSADELNAVEAITEAPQDFIRSALDPEESSRIEIEDNHILVLINVPINHDSHVYEYDTIPLGIIITPDYIVTICQEYNDVIQNFSETRFRYFSTFKRTRLLFQILYRSAMLFLKDLRQMTRRSDQIEQDLRKSMKNEELFQLLDLQKGLTYYSMSLRSNKVVVERLLRLCSNPQVSHIIKFREEDEELLDDVRVEYDQAIEMAQIQTDVLAGMMDAFASVISNNLNIVMKFLASITIVMAIPTMVASFFGMNVPVPWEGDPMGFVIVSIVALGLTIVSIWVLWKKRLF